MEGGGLQDFLRRRRDDDNNDDDRPHVNYAEGDNDNDDGLGGSVPEIAVRDAPSVIVGALSAAASIGATSIGVQFALKPIDDVCLNFICQDEGVISSTTIRHHQRSSMGSALIA